MADRQLVVQSNTVVASPAADAETVVATVGSIPSLFAGQSVKLHFWCAVAAAADATQIIVKLRRDSVSGTQVGSTLTFAGTDILGGLLAQFDAYAIDPRTDVANATYVATLTCTTASAESTVAAVWLEARVD